MVLVVLVGLHYKIVPVGNKDLLHNSDFVLLDHVNEVDYMQIMIMMFHQLINSHYQKFVSYDNKSKKDKRR